MNCRLTTKNPDLDGPFWLAVGSQVKFIYSEKATNFRKISTLLLFYVMPVKSRFHKNFVAFSDYMNFNNLPLVSQLDIKNYLLHKFLPKAMLRQTFLTFIHFMSKYLTLIETGVQLREVLVWIKYQHKSVSGETFRHQININQITPNFVYNEHQRNEYSLLTSEQKQNVCQMQSLKNFNWNYPCLIQFFSEKSRWM